VLCTTMASSQQTKTASVLLPYYPRSGIGLRCSAKQASLIVPTPSSSLLTHRRLWSIAYVSLP